MSLAQWINLINNLAAVIQAIQASPAGPAFSQLLTALEQPAVAASVTPPVTAAVTAAMTAMTSAAKKA